MQIEWNTLFQRINEGDEKAVEEAERQVQGMPPSPHEMQLRRALVEYYTHAAGMRRTDFGARHLTRNYEAALGHMRVVVQATPGNPQDVLKFYWLLITTGRFNEAQAALESASHQISGRSPEFDLNVIATLARLHYKRGSLDKAASLYQHVIDQSIDLFGDHFDTHQSRFVGTALARLARIHINTGNPMQAAERIDTFPYRIELDILARTRRRADALIHQGPCSRHPDARYVDTNTMTIVCVKHGPKYGPDYVNRLYAMLRRHLPGGWRFVCITDDAQGLRAEVDDIDISRIRLSGWWTKIAMFDRRLPLGHDTVLYLDLDSVVVQPLTFLAGLKTGFHIFEHPDAPGFNSSVMLFDRRVAAPIFERISRTHVDRLPGDQEWIEECIPNADTFAPGVINLYRALEPDVSTTAITNGPTQIVTFPSNPKPHQITWGWVKDLWY